MGALALCVAFGESLCGIRSWLVAGTHHTVPHFMSSRCKSTKQIINSNINSLERSFANATHLKHDDELSRRCPWCFSMTYNEMYLPQPSSIPHCVFPIDFPMFSQYFSQMFSQYWKNIAPRFSTLFDLHPPKVHRGRERSRKSTAGGAAPRLAGGNSPVVTAGCFNNLKNGDLDDLAIRDYGDYGLMIWNLWWPDDIELVVTIMEFCKKHNAKRISSTSMIGFGWWGSPYDLSCFVTRVLALSTRVPALACLALTPKHFSRCAS